MTRRLSLGWLVVLVLALSSCSDDEPLPTVPTPAPEPLGPVGAGGSAGGIVSTDPPQGGFAGGVASGGWGGVDGFPFGGNVGTGGIVSTDPPGGAAGVAGSEGVGGGVVSVLCGDGVLGDFEECDLGLPPSPSGTTSGPCSSECVVLDMELPILPEQGPGGQRLGLGRHAIAGSTQGAAVAFVLPSDQGARIAFARFDTKGQILGTLADLSAEGGSDLWGHPVVAALDEGSYVAAWTDRFLDGDQLSVALRKVNPDGTLLAPPKVANPLVSFVQKQPDLVWNGSTLVAAWIDESDPFTAPDLRVRLFDANLTPLGDELFLASSEAAEASVALAALPGSWAAAWRSILDGQEQIEVRTQQGVSWSFGPFPALPADERPALLALDASRLLLTFSMLPAPGAPAQLRFAVLDLAAPGEVLAQPLAEGLAPSSWGQSQPSLLFSGTDLFVVWRTGAEPGSSSGQDLWIRQLGWEPLSGALQLFGFDYPLPRQKLHRAGDQRRPALTLISGPAPAIAAAWEDVGSGIFEEKNASRVFVQVDPLPFVRTSSGGSPEDNATACSNGLDDNDDGLTDCQDPFCMLAGFCQENTLAACSNGYDDNNDGLFDCLDFSCHPFCESFPDTCHDNQDNDSNGLVDCADLNCTFQCETSLLTCGDGLDNDNDGFSDCQDQDCIDANLCETTLAGCSDGVDNDGDGPIDCADPQCLAGGFCTEDNLALCHDGLDDDGDGLVDCQDSDCDAFCEVSQANCGDGIDNDGDGLVDCFDLECAIQFVCPEGTSLPSTCENGIDDDKDGFIDLADIGCLNL